MGAKTLHWMLIGLPAIRLTLPPHLAVEFCIGISILWGNNFLSTFYAVSKHTVYISLPEDTATVASEIVRKIRFHPTLENFLAVLGSPGPVLTVIRAVGPAMVTEPLMVSIWIMSTHGKEILKLAWFQAASDISWHCSLPILAVANDRSVRFWKFLLK